MQETCGHMEFEKIDCENANILVRIQRKNRKLREHMLLSACHVLRDLYFCVDVMNLACTALQSICLKVKKG